MSSFGVTPIETSAWSQAIRRQVEVAAKASAPLLLSGPAGSGKSHLARVLHDSGPRRDQPLISLDCAQLPGTLFFGEAFGHGSGGLVRGVGAALGSLRAAGDGTVVIENVDQLSPGARRELRRAMSERLVTPLGTVERVPFAARVIATTRLELVAAAQAGGFDPSLAGLLSEGDESELNMSAQGAAAVLRGAELRDSELRDAGHIRVVGLSERLEDIELLMDCFMHEFGGAESNKLGGAESNLAGCAESGVLLSSAALEWLRNYAWPDNVAELKGLVARLVASGHQRIGRVAVERILSPDLSPWSADQRFVEQTRFPGLGVHRLSHRATCSAAGAAKATCCKR